MSATVAQKIWDRHRVGRVGDRDVLYVDTHLVHDVSPQAFSALELRGLPVRRPRQTVATMDHNVATAPADLLAPDPLSEAQIQRLRENCARHDIALFGRESSHQGIVHVIGPELGITRPGMTVVCGDSHTSTHGALGAVAFGIGATHVEHVLATQTLLLSPPRQMAVQIDGPLPPGVGAKDVALAVVNTVGFGGATGYAVEFRGSAARAMSVESRLTLCNMSIEAGGRLGLVAPDDTTVEYVRGRRFAPTGPDWDTAVADWSQLYTDADAVFDRTVRIDATELEPTVTWGTTPAMSVSVAGRVPHAQDSPFPEQTGRALRYMGLEGGERITDLAVDRVFIGSCTNARIEDLRLAAEVLRGRRVAPEVNAMVVPGSRAVKLQAEAEGLHERFLEAGFEWREPGCSMCLAMNADRAGAGERVASTSNRNFEGRQGGGARTHLVSPAMAAAAAVAGHFIDVREVL